MIRDSGDGDPQQKLRFAVNDRMGIEPEDAAAQ
jgi:hypothetical protein